MRFRPPIALTLAALCYLAFRALILHTNFDAVAIPVFELPVMGNLAHLLASGEHGEPLARYYDNCGGHIVTGLLGAPLYALLGSSYLVLKLVPLGLGLATLILVWSLLARHYDRRAADLFAFLYAFGPPTLTKYSLLAKGNHFENLFFQVLVLALFLHLHTRGANARRLFATGAAAGFALFVYFGSVVLIAGLALLHLFIRGRRSVRDLPAALGGFALGAAPLLWIQLATGGQPQDFVRAKLGTDSPIAPAELLARLGSFFREVLPSSAVFEDLGPLSARWAELLFLACFAAAWLYLLVDLIARARRLKENAALEPRARELARLRALQALPFVLYLPCFAVLISSTTFSFAPYAPPVEIGRFRYLVPHFLLALIAIALAAAYLWRGSILARAFGTVLAASALVTGLFSLPIVDRDAPEFGLGQRYAGHQFILYSNVSMRFPQTDPETGLPQWDPRALRESMAGFSPAHRREGYVGVGHYASWAVWVVGLPRTEEAQARLPLDYLLEPHPPEARIALARGVGSMLRRLLASEAKLDELAFELAALAETGHAFVPWVVEGLCLDVQFPLVHLLPNMASTSEALGLSVPAELLGSYRRGLGTQAGRLVARGLEADLAFFERVLAGLEDPHDPDFWFGLGWGLAEGSEGRSLPENFDELVPAAQRATTLTGFGASLRDQSGAQVNLPEAEAADRAALLRGALWPAYPAPFAL